MQRTSTLQKIRANSYQNVIINFSSINLKDSPNLFAARIKIKLKIASCINPNIQFNDFKIMSKLKD